MNLGPVLALDCGEGQTKSGGQQKNTYSEVAQATQNISFFLGAAPLDHGCCRVCLSLFLSPSSPFSLWSTLHKGEGFSLT
jgi:hypothetical protein